MSGSHRAAASEKHVLRFAQDDNSVIDDNSMVDDNSVLDDNSVVDDICKVVTNSTFIVERSGGG